MDAATDWWLSSSEQEFDVERSRLASDCVCVDMANQMGNSRGLLYATLDESSPHPIEDGKMGKRCLIQHYLEADADVIDGSKRGRLVLRTR